MTKTLNHMEFDDAPQPVVANGIVFFGSSSDDTIRALDARTGQTRWQFTTGGPVNLPRLPPVLAPADLAVQSGCGTLRAA